jgi:hypothetical protein
MFHPDIMAALAKERRNAMLAEAAAARLSERGRETRRHRRVPISPEVRRVVPVAGQLGHVCARTVRRWPGTLEYVTRIGPWLAGLPSASGPHRPATVAAREKGSKA